MVELRTESVRAMVVVKAYPQLSQKYGEAVCVAGIRMDREAPEWLRLYPVDFRDRPEMERFQKYDEIIIQAGPHRSDTRPETLTPDLTKPIRRVRQISPNDDWATRRSLVEPLLIESMCELRRRQAIDKTSLGVFRPAEVLDLVVEPASKELRPGQKLMREQQNLLTPIGAGAKADLELVPFKFSYRYRCSDRGCQTHTQSVIDWEIGALWQNLRRLGEAEMKAKIRQKWLEEMCGPDRDTAFFVGNIFRHQTSFVVIGVFWPPRTDQLSLI